MMYLGHNVIMWILFLASVALVILFPPFVLIVPFVCGFFCWKLCEPDFNYARLLKDKREHPEKYQSEQPQDDEDEYEDEDEEVFEDDDDSGEDGEEYDEDDELDDEDEYSDDDDDLMVDEDASEE